MLPDDPLARVLYVDLSKRAARVEKRPDLFEKGVGGTGVAIRLLDEECPKGADPLGAENPVILAVGPLTGLFPLASKTVAMFKSPHTGNLGESHAGGRSAGRARYRPASGRQAHRCQGDKNHKWHREGGHRFRELPLLD